MNLTKSPRPAEKEPAWPDVPTSGELIPLSSIALELPDTPTVDELERRLAESVKLDSIGRRCVDQAVARMLLDAARQNREDRDRRIEADQERVLRRKAARVDRTATTIAELEAQLDALMNDPDINEQLQATFADSLIGKIRRLKEGEPPPEVVDAGYAFNGLSDDELEEHYKMVRREAKKSPNSLVARLKAAGR